MRSTSVTVMLLLPFFCSADLPDFVEKCSASDPRIDECFMDRFVKVKPHILNGYKEFNIPKLNPLHLNQINVEATKTLSVKLTDINIYGLENAICTNTTADFPKMKGSVTILIPFMRATAHYDINGNVLILPINGNGPAELNITNAMFWLDFSWTMYEKNGKTYASLANGDLKYKTELMQFHLENLFNGNKALGDEMNAFINENWREFAKEIEPSVSQTLLKLIWNIYDGIAKSVPYYDLFLP